LRHFRRRRDIVPFQAAGNSLPTAPGKARPKLRKEFAMAWIAALGLMIGGMVTLQAFCAELTFRRLEPRER
jgi:hypothetical protein